MINTIIWIELKPWVLLSGLTPVSTAAVDQWREVRWWLNVTLRDTKLSNSPNKLKEMMKSLMFRLCLFLMSCRCSKQWNSGLSRDGTFDTEAPKSASLFWSRMARSAVPRLVSNIRDHVTDDVWSVIRHNEPLNWLEWFENLARINTFAPSKFPFWTYSFYFDTVAQAQSHTLTNIKCCKSWFHWIA